MALKKCRECGKEVSSQAKTCPNCGINKPVRGISFVAWSIIFLFFYSFYIVASAPPPDPQKQAKQKEVAARELRESAARENQERKDALARQAQEEKARIAFCEKSKPLDGLISLVMVRIENQNQKIYVNRTWDGLLVDQKEGLVTYIFECYSGHNPVLIYDAFTGVKLAKFDVFGFKVILP